MSLHYLKSPENLSVVSEIGPECLFGHISFTNASQPRVTRQHAVQVPGLQFYQHAAGQHTDCQPVHLLPIPHRRPSLPRPPEAPHRWAAVTTAGPARSQWRRSPSDTSDTAPAGRRTSNRTPCGHTQTDGQTVLSSAASLTELAD